MAFDSLSVTGCESVSLTADLRQKYRGLELRHLEMILKKSATDHCSYESLWEDSGLTMSIISRVRDPELTAHHAIFCRTFSQHRRVGYGKHILKQFAEDCLTVVAGPMDRTTFKTAVDSPNR
jgi:hypothetical protein